MRHTKTVNCSSAEDTGPNSTVRVKIDIFVMAVRITLQKLQLIYIQEGEV